MVYRRKGRKLRGAVANYNPRRAAVTAAMAAVGPANLRRAASAAWQTTKNAARAARRAGAKSSLQRKIIFSDWNGAKPKLRSATYNVAPKTIVDPGAYDQWRDYKRSYKLGNVTTKKLIKNTIDKMRWRFQRLDTFSGQGALWLARDRTASVSNYPFYLFDLTCMDNSIGASGTQNNPIIGYRLRSSGSVFDFTPVDGQGGTGLSAGTYNTGGWICETAPGASATLKYPHDSCILNWVNVKLNVWGAKAKPTKVYVQLVQLPEWMQPDDVMDITTASLPSGITIKESNGGMVAGTSFASPTTSAYTQILTKLLENPISQSSRGRKESFKVIKSQTIIIDPTSTTESDQNPHCKTVSLFYKFGRRQNFNWEHGLSGELTALDLTDNVNDYAVDQAAPNTCYVHPKARYFLMVSAHNYYLPAVDAAPSNTNDASFDILIRKEVIQSN